VKIPSLLLLPALALANWLFQPTATPAPANPVSPAAFVAVDGRQFLQYDPRGDGRLVEVFGDLAHASRVAVLVPGVDVRLDNIEPRLLSPARQLYGQTRALDPAAAVAVVAWLGYDPPEGVGRDAAREDRAVAGAVALESFIDRLVAAHPAVAITLIGHSYGSVVAGLVAPNLPAQVVDIVAIGSPGMGVWHAADLHTPAHVWAGTAAGDWIRWAPGLRIGGLGHGTHPNDPVFGAHPLPVRDVLDHNGYFAPGTDALRAMAEITLGRL
jgi:hypothetical protein